MDPEGFTLTPARVEPSAAHREFATAMFQMKVALVDSGFTESEALAVIGHVLTDGIGGK